MDAREKEIEKLKDYKYGFSTDIESTTAPKGLNEEVITLFQILKKNLSGCLILD
jgi:Fe-S cluster assembly protein SufB